jgi:uncharacterized protein (DUF2267 family)
MRKSTVVIVSAGAVAAATVLLLLTGKRRSRVRRLLRQVGHRRVRAVRHLVGRWQGVRYRLKRRSPDPGVGDLVLADRIRSTIGPLERRLDVPRVHVMVKDHVALLHGEVDSPDQIDVIEHAVCKVSGVRSVESYLRIGLAPGDTRPSAGGQARSGASRRLLAAAQAAGAPEDRAPAAVRAVLAGLAAQLPPREFERVRAHLPADVRCLLELPRRRGGMHAPPSPARILGAVTADGGGPDTAQQVVAAVLGELKRLVPGEVAGVAAVLPAELRTVWEAA